jgi:hypothetical protein
MMQTEASYPAVFRAADAASLQGQSDVTRRMQAALVLVIFAAACGMARWRVGDADLDVLAACALVAFVGSGLLTVTKGYGDAERQWYKGRAVAESVKTLAWRYAAGGDPFPMKEPEQKSDGLLLDRIKELLIHSTDLALDTVGGDQITDEMRMSRRLPFDQRKARYLDERIGAQITWYLDKGKTNKARRRTWGQLSAGANALGAIGALIKFLGVFDINVLGLAATAAGAATAWTQLRQHRVLAMSYAVAAQDLSLARTRLAQVTDEDAWVLEVGDAEEAISREHTMWLARHGHPLVGGT